MCRESSNLSGTQVHGESQYNNLAKSRLQPRLSTQKSNLTGASARACPTQTNGGRRSTLGCNAVFPDSNKCQLHACDAGMSQLVCGLRAMMLLPDSLQSRLLQAVYLRPRATGSKDEIAEMANTMPPSTAPPATTEPSRFLRLGVTAASATRGSAIMAATPAATPTGSASCCFFSSALRHRHAHPGWS